MSSLVVRIDVMDVRTAPDAVLDDRYLVCRLEEAGSTLLSLPNRGFTTHLRTGGLEFVRDAIEAYGWSDARIRPAIPGARNISAMDEAYGWLKFIPADRFVLRRIVGARSLVHPITDRHLFPWNRIGKALGADHKAVQRWHAEAIALILRELTRRTGVLPAHEKIFAEGFQNAQKICH